MLLTQENCQAKKSEKGNIYITHPQFKTNLRFYATVEELTANKEWRTLVAVREGNEGGFYAVLAKTPLEDLNV